MRALRRLVDQVYVDDRLVEYIVDLVHATRDPLDAMGDLRRAIEVGASPRASIAITMAARARAFLEGRAFVTPADVKMVALPTLRHRVVVNYEAEAEGVTSDDVVTRMLDVVPIP